MRVNWAMTCAADRLPVPVLAIALLLSGCGQEAEPSAVLDSAASNATLAPGTYARATRDDLTIHREAGSPKVVSTLYAGEWLLTVSTPTELDGMSWIRVQYGDGSFGWIGVDPDDPPFEAVEPECPDGPADRALEVHEVVSMTLAERLLCFGDDTITLSPVTWRSLATDNPYGGEPAWLADEARLQLYGHGGWEREAPLPAHLDPDGRVALAGEGWAAIRGRFDHQASSACVRQIDIGGLGIVDEEAFIAELVPVAREDGVLWCRQQFVITEVTPIAAPEPFVDPVAAPAGGTWRAIPEAPLTPRSQHGAVWTGTEMIVWGGWASEGAATAYTFFAAADGAAYDPASNAWRPIAQAPVVGRSAPQVAWTGSEMLVIGGYDATFSPLTDGAAYDPATDAWRTLAPLPAEFSHVQPAIAWAGRELVAVAGNGTLAVAYRPESDTWRELPAPPLPDDLYSVHLVSSGDEIIAMGSPNGISATAVFAVYDPASEEWRRLPESPVVALNGSAPVWIGGELLVISRSLATGQPEAVPPDTTYISLYNPETDSWRTAGAQEVYQPTGASIWTGDLLISVDAAYDPSEDAWMALPSHPPREGFSQVWTGDEVLIWGGGEGGESMIQLGNGLAYRPEAR